VTRLRGSASGSSSGRVRIRAALGVAGAALIGATAALAAGSSVNLVVKLAPEIARAKTGKVAVLVPSSIHADVAASKLYASGGLTTKGYDIQLAYAPRCDDATACFFAEFEGGQQAKLPGTRVALAHAISGTYSGIHCGASCGPASIQWKQGGVLYSVQYVLGGKTSMIALADQAIDAGPR
jgi:hypothetical protein